MSVLLKGAAERHATTLGNNLPTNNIFLYILFNEHHNQVRNNNLGMAEYIT